MHRRRIVLPLALLVAACFMPSTAQAAQSEDSYIVVYRGSVDDPNAETAQRERSQRFDSRFRYRHAIKGFAARLTASQVQRLEADPEVAYVVPDRPVYALETLAPGDSAPFGIQRIGAASGTTIRGAAAVNVAVIDTGIDLAHTDLNAADGYDCVTPGTSAQDDHGHGTHVAGTIAARNNGQGLVGIAAGTRVVGVKVLNSAGSGTTSQVVCGIDWVTGTRADSDPTNDIAVANMSLGGSGPTVGACATTTDPEHRAICRSTDAGVVYAVAAGNSARAFDSGTPAVPAAYPQVLTVSAIGDSDGSSGGVGPAPSCRTGEADDRYASFSNWAATTAGQQHTLAAPGVCVLSTRVGGGTTTMSGTSMASPHVAGAAALCISDGTCAGLAANQPSGLIQKLVRTDTAYGFAGDPSRPVSGRYYGHLTWAGAPGSAPPPPPPPPPTTAVSSAPGATVIETGTLRSGSVANLAADDASYFRVNSTTSGTRTSSWRGEFTAVPSTLSNLRVSYKGSNSRTCTQVVSIYRWADGVWVTLDSRSVGTSQVSLSNLAPSGTLSNYVSGAGELRVRIRCTRGGGGSFYSSGNLLRIAYDQPA
jgi:subtilisin